MSHGELVTVSRQYRRLKWNGPLSLYSGASGSCVFGFAGVVPVFSGSFLGSVPSVDVACKKFVSAQLQNSQIAIRRPDQLFLATHQSHAIIASSGSQASQQRLARHSPSLHAVMIQSS